MSTSLSSQISSVGNTVQPIHLISGQLNLLVDHDANLSSDTIAAIIKQDPIFNDAPLTSALLEATQITSFQKDHQSFSFVPVDLTPAGTIETTLQLINSLNSRLKQRKPANPAGDTINLSHNTVLRMVTPNWLVGSTQAWGGATSPGGHPVAVPPAALVNNNPFWQFQMPAGLSFNKPLPERGEGVDVYILDTIHPQSDLDQAYQRWVTNQSQPHPILAGLLGPKGALRNEQGNFRIHKANTGHLQSVMGLQHKGRSYSISDHGLFIAGIIHAIAPKAKLHLVEVCNSYGIGTLRSFVNGFVMAAQGVTPTSKRLVNASLTLNVVQPNQQWLDHIRQENPFWNQFTIAQIEEFVLPLRRVCETLGQLDVTTPRYPQVGMVAAAGNDYKPSLSFRPPARYPAAFSGVLGVGALNRDNTPTDYSNLSDFPLDQGIVAFGGNIVTNTEYADVTHGIVGPYIGAFPDGTVNNTGWARWTGTSFATAIITATIAALISEGHTFSSATQALKAVRFTPEATVLGETFPVLGG